MKHEKWKEYWLKNSEIWVVQVQVMPYRTLMYLSQPHTLTYPFQSMLNVLSGQPRVLTVIQSQLIPQWPWNCIVNPSQKGTKSYLSHVTIKAFFISVSIISLWFTLLSFTLYPIGFISLTQFWCYIELLMLCASFNYTISLKVTIISMSIIYLLHIPTLHLWSRVQS